MGFQLVRLYHPSHRVPDLVAAEAFFKIVFGIDSVWRSTIFPARDPKYPDLPIDYCIFTSIADVFFDCIDPQKLIIDGKQLYDTVVDPHLHGFGWGVEGIGAIYQRLNAAGVQVTNYRGEITNPGELPQYKDTLLFFTTPESTGIRLEFYPVKNAGTYPGGYYDSRADPSWELHPEHGKGPLGIQYCSHHTILSDNPERWHKVYIDCLGGRVIHQQKDTLRGTDSTFVALSDGVLEFAKPTALKSVARTDFADAPRPQTADLYHALTFKVVDLAKVEAHLKATGTRIIAQSRDMIIIHPEDGLGIPWGFTTKVTPGDTRFGGI